MTLCLSQDTCPHYNISTLPLSEEGVLHYFHLIPEVDKFFFHQGLGKISATCSSVGTYVKIIKMYLGKCFSSPRRLGGGKMPNLDPSHLIYEI
jgi:heme/copper-type cytochrome/quinol oxidase subunit 1